MRAEICVAVTRTRIGRRRSTKKAQVQLTPLIIFVRNFERCVKFYRSVFGLSLVRKRGHWAEFQVSDIRLAVHGDYEGPPHRQGKPLAVHFVVRDSEEAIGRIQRFGGSVKAPKRWVDGRPSELKAGWEAHFLDPDGNEFEVQEVRRFD